MAVACKSHITAAQVVSLELQFVPTINRLFVRLTISMTSKCEQLQFMQELFTDPHQTYPLLVTIILLPSSKCLFLSASSYTILRGLSEILYFLQFWDLPIQMFLPDQACCRHTLFPNKSVVLRSALDINWIYITHRAKYSQRSQMMKYTYLNYKWQRPPFGENSTHDELWVLFHYRRESVGLSITLLLK